MQKNNWLIAALASKTSINTIVTMLGNILTGIIGLLFTIVVARTLAPSNFGQFTVLATISVIVVGIADLGTASSLTNFLPKTSVYKNQLITLMFWFQILISCFILVSLLASYPLWRRLIPGISFNQAVLIGWLSFAFILNGFGQKVMRAQGYFSRVAILQICDNLVKLTLTLLLIYIWKKWSINTLLLGTSLAALTSGLLGLFWSLRSLIIKFNVKMISTLFSFAKWGAMIEVSNEILVRLDVILLSMLSNTYQVGIYAAANRITLVVIVLSSTLNAVVATRFSAITTVQELRAYSGKLFLMILAIASTFLPLYYLAPTLIFRIYGSDYLLAVPIFRLIVLSAIPLLFSLIASNAIIYTLGQPNYVATAKFLQLSAFLVLSVIAIPKFGSLGPAIALLAANMFYLTTTTSKYLLAQRTTKLNNIHRFDPIHEFPAPYFQKN